MAKVQVRATRLGYYDNKRWREGMTLVMDDKNWKKDAAGKIVFPSWVVPLSKKPKAEVIEETVVEDDSDEVL